MIESASEFRRLRESDNPELYQRAATEPASLETWAAIVKSMPDMRFWVAQNKTVPLSVLTVLATDSDSNVRHMVAQKRKIDTRIQLLLACDAEMSVRLALANNAKLSPVVLDILLTDRDDRVRLAAGRHGSDSVPANGG